MSITLKRPKASLLPWTSNNSEKWSLVLFIALFVPFFLIVFQPFGVNNYDTTHKISGQFVLGYLGFGLVSALAIGIFEFLIAPAIFKKAHGIWGLTRMLMELWFLTTCIFLFYNWMGNFHDWHWQSYLGFLRDVSLMSIIPILLVMLFLRYRNTGQQPVEASDRQKPLIWLRARPGLEQMALAAADVLYIEAQDNYVAVNFLQNGAMQRKLLRIPLNQLEKQLATYGIIRCHRSFLVNIDQIKNVSGNSHQLNLHLPHSSVNIPVSRRYVERVKEILAIHIK